MVSCWSFLSAIWWFSGVSVALAERDDNGLRGKKGNQTVHRLRLRLQRLPREERGEDCALCWGISVITVIVERFCWWRGRWRTEEGSRLKWAVKNALYLFWGFLWGGLEIVIMETRNIDPLLVILVTLRWPSWFMKNEVWWAIDWVHFVINLILESLTSYPIAAPVSEPKSLNMSCSYFCVSNAF